MSNPHTTHKKGVHPAYNWICYYY